MSDQRLTMREQLSANYDKAGVDEGGATPHDPGAPRGEPAAEVVRVKPDTEVADPNNVKGAVRAEAPIVTNKDKKFEKAAKPAEVKPADAKPDDKTPARAADGKFTAKKYPGTWKQDLAPLWEKPGGHTAEEWAKIQEEALRRETVYSTDQGTFQKRLNEMEPVYKGITEVFQPYKDTFARRGLEPVAVMKQLLALADHADRDPAGFIKEQAQMRGLDLASLVQQQGNPEPVDPKYAALENKLRSLESHIQSGQQNAQAQTQQSVTQQIQAFQTAAKEDGSPKHPHFERVKAKMGALMSADPNLDLDGAYRDACYADPEVRESQLADEWTAREAKRTDELKRASDAAKSQRGGTGGQINGAQSLPKGSSIRAQLSANWDRLNGDARVS